MNAHVTKVFMDLRTKARADTRGHSVSIMITCTVGPDTYLKKKWNRHNETIAKVIKLQQLRRHPGMGVSAAAYR